MHDYTFGFLVFLCSVSLHVTFASLSQVQMPIWTDRRPSAEPEQVIETCDALAKLSPENTFAQGTINYASEAQGMFLALIASAPSVFW